MNSRALKVKDFCGGIILVTERDCPLYDAIRWLDEYQAEQAVIVEDRDGSTAVLGIVNREDLASTLLTRPDYDDLSLEDVMNDSPVIVSENDDLDSAVGSLESRGQALAIVVNAGGEMVGLLSLAEVMQLEDSGSRLATAA